MTNQQQILYPSPRDLELILIDSVRYTDMLSFLRKRGIFCFNNSKESLASQISRHIWDESSLEELRSLAYRSVNKKILSGFTLISADDFQLDAIYNSLRNNGDLRKDGYRLHCISRKKSSTEIVYEGSLSYQKKSAGKMQFIRNETREVSFEMRPINNKEWQVEVDGGKSNDGKVVYSLLEKIAKTHHVAINMLRIDKLTKGDTITFFDNLAKEGLPKEWVVEDISRITLKLNPGTKDDNEKDTEEIDADVDEESLNGITQAILEGKNLREQPFVQRAQSSGYAFTSMTYTFGNASENVKVKLRAEFKGSPKIFEVGLESYMLPSVESSDQYEESMSQLDDSENMLLRSMFWNKAKSLYYSLLGNNNQADSN